MLRGTLIAILILTLLGCNSTKGYDNLLNTWVGKDVDELITAWGYPKDSFKAPNRNTVYVFSRSRVYTMPQNTGGQTLYFNCTTYFEVDEDGLIVGGRWEGNSCRA